MFIVDGYKVISGSASGHRVCIGPVSEEDAEKVADKMWDKGYDAEVIELDPPEEWL